MAASTPILEPYLEPTVAKYDSAPTWMLYGFAIRFVIDLCIESLFLYRLLRHPLVRHQYFSKLIAPFFISDVFMTLQCATQCTLNSFGGSYILRGPGCLWQVIYLAFGFTTDQATLAVASYASYQLLSKGRIFTSSELNKFRFGCVVYGIVVTVLSSFAPAQGTLRASGAYCLATAHTIMGAVILYGCTLGTPLLLQLVMFCRSLLYHRAARSGRIAARPGMAQHMHLSKAIAIFPLVYVASMLLVVGSHLWEWAAGMKQAPPLVDYIGVFNAHTGSTAAGLAMMVVNVPFRLAVLDTPGLRQIAALVASARDRYARGGFAACCGCSAGVAPRGVATAGGEGGRGRASSHYSVLQMLETETSALHQILGMLALKPVREAFTLYLTKSFCQESLLFIESVEALHVMRRPRAWTGGADGGGDSAPLSPHSTTDLLLQQQQKQPAAAAGGDSLPRFVNPSPRIGAGGSCDVNGVVAPATATASRVLRECDTILATYIEQGSELQVNIPGPLRAQLEVTVASPEFRGSPDTAVFDEAQAVVATMLRDDVLPRFHRCDAYKKLKEELGAEVA